MSKKAQRKTFGSVEHLRKLGVKSFVKLTGESKEVYYELIGKKEEQSKPAERAEETTNKEVDPK